MYIVKCFNENEEFIKIGKTFRTLKDRFEEIPYNFLEIKIKEFKTAKECSKYEKEIHRKVKNFKYCPRISFGGRFECYSFSALEEGLK